MNSITMAILEQGRTCKTPGHAISTLHVCKQSWLSNSPCSHWDYCYAYPASSRSENSEALGV